MSDTNNPTYNTAMGLDPRFLRTRTATPMTPVVTAQAPVLPILTPAAFLGDLSADRIVCVGHIPQEGVGILVRALHVLVDTGTTTPSGAPTYIPPVPGHYWTLFLGTFDGEEFVGTAEVALTEGLRSSPVRFALSPEFRATPGSIVAVKALQRGSPAPLSGLSVVLEVGLTGQR